MQENGYASGAIMFMRKLTNKKNALIAWKLKSSYVIWRDNKDIDLTYPSGDWTNAEHTSDYIKSRNANLNFVLTINEYSFTVDGWYKFESRHFQYINSFCMIMYSASCNGPENHVRSFAARHAIVNQVKKPKFPEPYSFHPTKNNYSI